MSMLLPNNFYSESLDKAYLKTELENLKFSYGDVKYENFSDNYNKHQISKDDIISRFLFSAAYAAIAKTTYHAALTIFAGLPQALYHRNSDYVKMHAQYIVRDFQEAVGYLIAGLYDSKWGLFMIQESIIQKHCYDQFPKEQTIPNKHLNVENKPLESPKTHHVKPKNPQKTYEQMANDHYDNKEYKLAYEKINHHSVDIEIQADFYVKLADAYFEEKEYGKSLGLITNLGSMGKAEIKGPIVKKLADFYLSKGYVLKAYELISNKSITEDVRSEFVMTLLSKLEKEKNWKDLQTVAGGCEKTVKHKYFALIIKQYLMDKTTYGKKNADQLIVQIFKTAFRSTLNLDDKFVLEGLLAATEKFALKHSEILSEKFLVVNPTDGIDYIYQLAKQPTTSQTIQALYIMG